MGRKSAVRLAVHNLNKLDNYSINLIQINANLLETDNDFINEIIENMKEIDSNVNKKNLDIVREEINF